MLRKLRRYLRSAPGVFAGLGVMSQISSYGEYSKWTAVFESRRLKREMLRGQQGYRFNSRRRIPDQDKYQVGVPNHPRTTAACRPLDVQRVGKAPEEGEISPGQVS
jgi:hypothetical protein